MTVTEEDHIVVHEVVIVDHVVIVIVVKIVVKADHHLQENHDQFQGIEAHQDRLSLAVESDLGHQEINLLLKRISHRTGLYLKA